MVRVHRCTHWIALLACKCTIRYAQPTRKQPIDSVRLFESSRLAATTNEVAHATQATKSVKKSLTSTRATMDIYMSYLDAIWRSKPLFAANTTNIQVNSVALDACGKQNQRIVIEHMHTQSTLTATSSSRSFSHAYNIAILTRGQVSNMGGQLEAA